VNAAAFSLVVLTLNVAGPRRVHQGWPSRREAIETRLKAAPVDAAAYQEIWRDADAESLGETAGHPHRALDSALGVAVTSREAITQRSSLALGRGYGALRARLASGVDLYSARLEAGDGGARARRLTALFRLAEFVRLESTGHPYVLLGDLGTGSDEREIELLLDLLEARDLCVAHGDEVCGRTLGDRRVDYVLIPYSSRLPKENARAVFTDLLSDEDGPVPVHFGLSARFDGALLALKPAAKPSGRDEALAQIAATLERFRDEDYELMPRAGWIPFLGAARLLELQGEVADLTAAIEEIRGAQIRSSLPLEKPSSQR
jgi:hypothetical protein